MLKHYMRPTLAGLLAVALAACSGDDGAQGAAGAQGPAGPAGPQGESGTAGAPGSAAPLPAGAGFSIDIESAAIADDGTVTATVRATDAVGAPVDIVAENLAFGFTAAVVPATGSAKFALPGITDHAGTLRKVGDGLFEYVYAPKAQNVDRTATYRVGVYIARPFLGVDYPGSDSFDFVPAGGAPIVREIVKDSACNACHTKLTMHEAHGAPRGVGLCQTCHTSQLAIMMPAGQGELGYMVHKLHAGAELANGFTLAGKDFSHVEFPVDANAAWIKGSALKNCTVCHQGATADNYKTKPTRAACGSCHDAVDFATGANHIVANGAPMADDAACAYCHTPESIVAKHAKPAGPKVELAILEVRDVAVGSAPVVKFQVKVDGVGRDIQAQPLSSLAINAAGPTTDYASYVGTPVDQAAATAIDAANGIFEATLPASVLPANATGKTWAFALEGKINGNPMIYWGAVEPIAYAAVGGGTPVPRRVVVEDAKCNACHVELGGHGGQRKNVQACALCHNANNDNADRVAHVEGTTVLPESVQLSVMVHKIHAGKHLSSAYALGAHPAPSVTNPAGTAVAFVGEFPAGLTNCQACHAPGTYAIGLPIQAGVLPTVRWELSFADDGDATPGEFVSAGTVTRTVTTPPNTAVCTSCHDTPAAAAHAQLNTWNGIETCAVCHGEGAEFDALGVHRARP